MSTEPSARTTRFSRKKPGGNSATVVICAWGALLCDIEALLWSAWVLTIPEWAMGRSAAAYEAGLGPAPGP